VRKAEGDQVKGRILEIVRRHGPVTNMILCRIIGCHRQTISDRVQELVESKALVMGPDNPRPRLISFPGRNP
jgi:DNA-binding Lrp family transcriptional regulator